jgi:hypothetical protein
MILSNISSNAISVGNPKPQKKLSMLFGQFRFPKRPRSGMVEQIKPLFED